MTVRALNPPLLVCVDFQREYAARGRPLHIFELDTLLARASRLLDHARSEGWIIAHSLLCGDGLLFGAQTEQARTLSGFEPLGAEMVFRRQGFSVYGDKEFRLLLERNRGSITLMMGVGGPFSLLHTAMDAYARCDELVLIEDVIGAPDIGSSPAHDVAAVTLAIAGSMHRLVASEALIAWTQCTGHQIERSSPALIGGEMRNAL